MGVWISYTSCKGRTVVKGEGGVTRNGSENRSKFKSAIKGKMECLDKLEIFDVSGCPTKPHIIAV